MADILTQTGFDKLLTTLDAEREQAGFKHENLRQRLIKFFEWRNCEIPEELTDIVFDRVTLKMSEGVEIQNVSAYSSTVAQFVFKEFLRSNQNQNQLIEDNPEVQNMKQIDYSDDEIQNERETCLDKCLKEFSDDNRRLIIALYDTDEHIMIPTRKRLAENMNISLNVLRIRVCRLKSKLEVCTISCCGEG